LPAVLAARDPGFYLLRDLQDAIEQYEKAVKNRDWVSAVSHDLHFHSQLVRFHGNKRLTSFYENVIGELRVGMVLVDRSHDNPSGLIPVHRKIFQLLSTGKLKRCAAALEQHLEDSESRLTDVYSREGNTNTAGVLIAAAQ
jgi:DNA-binding GntR family transcriptional regulator